MSIQGVTEQELSILKDTEFLLLKQKVIQKLWKKLEELEKSLKKTALSNSRLFPEKTNFTGKVSRGENYQHLPYLVLDCPRLLKPKNIFTVRTMIWWGNDISCTLHIQGEAFETYKNRILSNISTLYNEDFYICVNDTPWQYHFRENNYLKVKDLSIKEVNQTINNSGFIKISKRMSIKEVESLHPFALDTFNRYLKLLSPTF